MARADVEEPSVVGRRAAKTPVGATKAWGAIQPARGPRETDCKSGGRSMAGGGAKPSGVECVREGVPSQIRCGVEQWQAEQPTKPFTQPPHGGTQQHSANDTDMLTVLSRSEPLCKCKCMTTDCRLQLTCCRAAQKCQYRSTCSGRP